MTERLFTFGSKKAILRGMLKQRPEYNGELITQTYTRNVSQQRGKHEGSQNFGINPNA